MSNVTEERNPLHEWNVVINLNERARRHSCEKLAIFGPIRKTGFFNVLLMKVENLPEMLETLRKWILEDPQSLSFLSSIIPAACIFIFQSPEEFETKAREAAIQWASALSGKGFHVRMRRRGFKGKLSSLDEEHLLDGILLEAIAKTGKAGHITFNDPDAIVSVETIGPWAGLSFWGREDLKHYPFIRLD